MKNEFGLPEHFNLNEIAFETTNNGRYGHVLIKMGVNFKNDKKHFHNAIFKYHRIWLFSLKSAYLHLAKTGRILTPDEAEAIILEYGNGIVGDKLSYEVYSRMSFLLRSSSRRVNQYYLRDHHETPNQSYLKAIKREMSATGKFNDSKVNKEIVNLMLNSYCVQSFYREYTPFRATERRQKNVGAEGKYGVPYKLSTNEIRFPEPIGYYQDKIFSEKLFDHVFELVPFGYSFYGYSIHADLKNELYWLSFDFKLDSGYMVDTDGFLRLRWNNKNKNVRYQAYMKHRKDDKS